MSGALKLTVVDYGGSRQAAGGNSGSGGERTARRSLFAAARGSGTALHWAAASYLAWSTLLLIVNKVAVHFLPSASVVLFCQLVITYLVAALGPACVTRGAVATRDLAPTDSRRLRAHAALSALLLATVVLGMRALRANSWETLLLLKCCVVPASAAWADGRWLGRRPLSKRAWAAIAALAAAAAVLPASRLSGFLFKLEEPLWAAAWLLLAALEAPAHRAVIESQPLSSWTRAAYVSLLALPPVAVYCLLTGQHVVAFVDFEWNPAASITLALSCLVSAAASVSGLHLRASGSATSYVVATNGCKVVTGLLALYMWSGLRALPAMAAVSGGLAAAVALYRQADAVAVGPGAPSL